MVTGRNALSYLSDLIYGASKYPSGWFRPMTVKGYFNTDENGNYQRLFFKELLKIGFRRTPWQLVFPSQTAGLIKRIKPLKDGTDEYHVRFYSDGVIDCELEVNRFNGWHWAGPRKHGSYLLEDVLENGSIDLSYEDKEKIKKQLGVKHYSGKCVRSKE